MECCQDDYQSFSLDSADLVSLQSVSESYFVARENDEDPVDSDSDSSSSDDAKDLEDTGEDVDFDVTEVHIFEKVKVETRELRTKDTGEPFTEIMPERRAAVTLRNGGKLMDAMVIALDGK